MDDSSFFSVKGNEQLNGENEGGLSFVTSYTFTFIYYLVKKKNEKYFFLLTNIYPFSD